MIAIPQDNRHVSIFDVSGTKMTRLPRDSRKCHMRMVSSVAWAAEAETWRCEANLFSAGFDRMALGWKVKSKEEGGGVGLSRAGGAGTNAKTRNKEAGY